MTFKPATWRPIAAVLSIANLVAVGFAAAQAEPWHAGVHAGLALVFGVWAERLSRRRSSGDLLPGEVPERLEALEGEVSRLGQELNETLERLDFAERVMAQAAEARRLGPER